MVQTTCMTLDGNGCASISKNRSKSNGLLKSETITYENIATSARHK